ncbi:hypothetical protein [Mycolicibacterium lutetiense]
MNQTTAIQASARTEPRIRDGVASHAERITAVSRPWAIRSLHAAYLRDGVETPVSGDQLTILAAPYRSAFYHRQRGIEKAYGCTRSDAGS